MLGTTLVNMLMYEDLASRNTQRTAADTRWLNYGWRRILRRRFSSPDKSGKARAHDVLRTSKCVAHVRGTEALCQMLVVAPVSANPMMGVQLSKWTTVVPVRVML